jgi:hypothetical protein
MLTTIAKRIQSRLSRLGVKASLGDIKSQCEKISDLENPTEAELLAIQEYFMSTANQLTVVDDVTTEETLTTEDVDSVNSENNDIDNISTLSIQELEVEAALTNSPAPLATTTQSQLITTTADQMGIVLDASEISLIAENINHSSDDFDQDIDSIKAAIMAFINHKSLINQSKINSLIHEVREVVTEKNSQNSQLLSDGLRSINQDIQESNKQFKSNVKQCLSAFELPALKAS